MAVATAPEVSDLVRRIFRARSLNFLAGEEGSGKSLLSMNGDLRLYWGEPRFLNWKIEKLGKVLFLNNEMYSEDVVPGD